MRTIEHMRGPYAFLNNYYVEPDGTSVEAEFQAEKTLNPRLRRRIVKMSPRQASGMGRRHLNLRPDWEEIKVARMAFFVERKFLDHRELRDRLLETGDAIIIEGNAHGDDLWGMIKGAGGLWEGRNELGIILMRLRSLL